MVKPEAMVPRPAFLLSMLGGLVATLLASALLFVAPAFGLPFVDVPRLIGGLFTSDPETALWLGYWIFFLLGVLAFGPALAFIWTKLPGYHVGFTGALVKGLLWGVILWVAVGLLLPLLGALNMLTGQELQNPGFFALHFGIAGALTILITNLAYGATLALVTAMGYGISPIQVIGWRGYSKGDIRHVPLSMTERPAWMRQNGGRSSVGESGRRRS